MNLLSIKIRKLTEGRKMWLSVMGIFRVWSIIFILFEDYDRKWARPFDEASDWHLLGFSLIVMVVLAFLLHRYSRRMDERISREQDQQKAMMRREMTQNISHELKTPVSSILGYMETILDNPSMSNEMKQKFIERSHTQAQRLTALLQDIATLNRMDYASDLLEWEHVDVSHVVADIAEETALALAQKQMTLHNWLPQGIVIQGIPSLIYSIFRNLMDNAINYAGEGTTIDISAEQQSDSWNFTFQDNGVGIAPRHLSRIFERFYRIDQGRSRSLGGTGLGLAIVKNAVQLHGGSIIARNTNGKGVRFDFKLKER